MRYEGSALLTAHRSAGMDDAHALDAVLAWLDAESLLRAAMVCRRWAERAARDEAWRGRVAAATGWTRGVRERDAYRRSLNVRARWRRGRVPAVTLSMDFHSEVLCGDDDRLAFTQRRHEVRWADGSADVALSRTVRIYDVAAARAVGTLPVCADVAALSPGARRCATIDVRRECAVWRPTAETQDGTWRAVCAVPFEGDVLGRSNARLRWQGDVLAVCAVDSMAARVRVRAEWFDVGAGEPRLVGRRECGDGHTRMFGQTLWCDAGAFALFGGSVYVLTAHAPPTDRAPQMKLPPAANDRPRYLGLTFRDGSALVTYLYGQGGRCLELWDTRAARPEAAGTVQIAHCRDILCVTARGTVLVWAETPCPQHTESGVDISCAACRVGIKEWDPARRTVDDALLVDHRSYSRVHCPWADERRAVLSIEGGGLCLLDADPYLL